MLFSFLDCVLQALGSACVQTDGCAINLAASPVQSLRCKPSAYLHGSFTRQGEKCTKKTKEKIPQAVTSDHTIHCYYFKKRNTEVQTESPCSVHLPAADSGNCLSSFLCKEQARKRMTSEDKKWVAHPRFCLKVTLQLSVVQRWFYYSSFNFLFFFLFPP